MKDVRVAGYSIAECPTPVLRTVANGLQPIDPFVLAEVAGELQDREERATRRRGMRYQCLRISNIEDFIHSLHEMNESYLRPKKEVVSVAPAVVIDGKAESWLLVLKLVEE